MYLPINFKNISQIVRLNCIATHLLTYPFLVIGMSLEG